MASGKKRFGSTTADKVLLIVGVVLPVFMLTAMILDYEPPSDGPAAATEESGDRPPLTAEGQAACEKGLGQAVRLKHWVAGAGLQLAATGAKTPNGWECDIAAGDGSGVLRTEGGALKSIVFKGSLAWSADLEGGGRQLSAWTYSTWTGEMEQRPTREACVNSRDQVVLDWPYKPVTAQLCLRSSPKSGRDIYFILNGDGQIICHRYSNCPVRIRFDDGAPLSMTGGDPSDGSTNAVFLRSVDSVARRLAAANSATIELTYYKAGSQAVSFPVGGLDLSQVGFAGR